MNASPALLNCPKECKHKKLQRGKATVAVVENIKKLGFEFIGTLAFMLAGFLTTFLFGGPLGGFGFGLAYIGAHAWLKSVSGGHFNPWVSISFFVTGYFPGGYSIGSLLLLAGYVAVQTLAALVAGWIANFYGALVGVETVPVNLVSGFGGVLLAEFLFTMFFLLVVLGTERPRGVHASMVNSSLVQGFFLAGAIALLAALGTGGSLNLARTFAPALINSIWTQFGAYALAGALATIAAVLLHFFQRCGYLFADGHIGMGSLLSDTLSHADGQCANDHKCKHMNKSSRK